MGTSMTTLSATIGGMQTLTVSSSSTIPWALQSIQGKSQSRPEPPHWRQFKKPERLPEQRHPWPLPRVKESLQYLDFRVVHLSELFELLCLMRSQLRLSRMPMY
jgi:hypothetical protein